MIDTLYLLVLFYIALELFELQWQKADSIMGMLLRMHQKYRQNVLIFLLHHPTFIFSVWLIMVSDFTLASTVLLFIKTVDIATKIILIDQVFEKREISQELSLILLTPLHPVVPYIGVLAYTPMVYLSLIAIS